MVIGISPASSFTHLTTPDYAPMCNTQFHFLHLSHITDYATHTHLQLGVTEKTHSIIQQSLDKLGIAGEPRDFNLFQIIGEKREYR